MTDAQADGVRGLSTIAKSSCQFYLPPVVSRRATCLKPVCERLLRRSGTRFEGTQYAGSASSLASLPSLLLSSLCSLPLPLTSVSRPPALLLSPSFDASQSGCLGVLIRCPDARRGTRDETRSCCLVSRKKSRGASSRLSCKHMHRIID